MGNYMNSGTRNAQAFAFEISFLPKVSYYTYILIIFLFFVFEFVLNFQIFVLYYLVNFIFQLSSTKDVENKTSVLHYLVDIIEKKYPELLTFGDELPHLDRAAKISIETIQKTMTQMRNDLKNLQTDINNCKSLPKDDDDKFEEVMTVSF